MGRGSWFICSRNQAAGLLPSHIDVVARQTENLQSSLCKYKHRHTWRGSRSSCKHSRTTGKRVQSLRHPDDGSRKKRKVTKKSSHLSSSHFIISGSTFNKPQAPCNYIIHGSRWNVVSFQMASCRCPTSLFSAPFSSLIREFSVSRLFHICELFFAVTRADLLIVQMKCKLCGTWSQRSVTTGGGDFCVKMP